MEFFPHESLRDGQGEFIKDIKSALKTGSILLSQAPTGLGKERGSVADHHQEHGVCHMKQLCLCVCCQTLFAPGGRREAYESVIHLTRTV